MSSSVQFPSAAFIILSQTSAQISCGEDGSAVSESAGHHAGRANLILEIMSNCGSVCLLLLFSNIKKKVQTAEHFIAQDTCTFQGHNLSKFAEHPQMPTSLHSRWADSGLWVLLWEALISASLIN